ncbi:MAG: hypothetical protein EZS28_000212 [Streblomastix strix]|uniref:Mos1 transposase HTH domain-containing protein n=1 Tax=Streblomastix strix TaxID=222440 RepID=A0A5J4XAS4_9EUKA|nr:MAG: hypothetical protein EZS28_000212 [Streblomastix strix]
MRIDPEITPHDAYIGIQGLLYEAPKRQVYGGDFAYSLQQDLLEISIRIINESKLILENYIDSTHRYTENINSRYNQPSMDLGSRNPVITEEQQLNEIPGSRKVLVFQFSGLLFKMELSPRQLHQLELRAVTKHYWMINKNSNEAHHALEQQYPQNCVQQRTVEDWYDKFENGDFSILDKERMNSNNLIEHTLNSSFCR